MSTSSAAPRARYLWFTGGVASWSLAISMNQVVLSWLLVGQLHETAGRVGAVQLCQQLPFLVFLLVGGLVADRAELRRLLAWLHVIAALLAMGLAAAICTGRLAPSVLAGYALCSGTLQALASPARDAMVGRVAGRDLLRAITTMTLTQYLAGALGARLGALAGPLGSAATLAVLAAVLVAGMVAVLGSSREVSPVRRADERAALRGGLREVARSPQLLPLALLVAANGLLFMGPFQVLCPLIVRDVYGGGVADLALPSMVLPLGTIAGSLAMLGRGDALHRGLAFLVALVGVALCLLAIAARPPFAVFVALIFAWGVCHAIFLNTSRSLFQQLASDAHRARVLSVHTLGTLGMAPFSHLGSGLLAERAGLAAGCVLAGAAMLAIVGVAVVATPLRRLA